MTELKPGEVVVAFEVMRRLCELANKRQGGKCKFAGNWMRRCAPSTCPLVVRGEEKDTEMTKRLIDWETLCENCHSRYYTSTPRCGHWAAKTLNPEQSTCPIWAGLERVPKTARELGRKEHNQPPDGFVSGYDGDA